MSDCGSGTGNNQCNPCGGGNGVGTWTGGGWTGGPIEAGPGLHIQASSTYFNYVNGKLDPPYQMLNFIARISGVESPVTWIAEPGVKTTPNSSTFSIDTEEFGERPFVMLTATAPNGEARSIMLTRAADPLATVGAPAGTPIASKMAEELVADVEDTKNRILSILSAIGSSQSAEAALLEVEQLKAVIEAAQGAADEAVLLTDTARDDAIREAQAAANSASVALAYKNQIVEIADGIDEDVATITQQAGIAAAAANAAGTSATAASTSAQTASAKASEAEISATAANAAKVSAETAAGQASTSATNAATSADTAAGSVSAAASSATLAAQSKQAAENAATASNTSAQQAATSASNAQASAGTAATQSSLAVEAKNQAETAATASNQSAQSAAGSADSAGNAASAAQTSAGLAATAKQGAETAAGASNTSAQQAAASANAAGTSASSASSSANLAATSQSAAGTSAQQAAASAQASQESAVWSSNSGQFAADRAWEASQFAGAADSSKIAAETANSQATVRRDESVAAANNASEAAAAAQASSVLAVNMAQGLINNNPNFTNWPSPTGFPVNWTWWGAEQTTMTRNTSLGGVQPFVLQLDVGAVENGIRQGWSESPGLTQLSGGFYVLEVEYRRGGGNVSGGGLYFESYNENQVFNGSVARTFSAMANNFTPDGWINHSEIVELPAGSRFGIIYLLTNWQGFGQTYAAKQMFFRKVGIRPATSAEIRDRTVLAPMQASVSTLQGAVADINGSAAFLEQKVAASGSNPAMMLMKAGKNGSGIGLIADKIALANYNNNGNPVDALVIENGEAYFNGKLRANSVLASQIVVSNRNDVFPDRGFYDLNWHGLQGLAVAGVSGVGGIQPARFLRILSTGGANVDRSSPEVPVEKGATYLIKYHVYVSPDFEGWIGNTIHMPWQAWYTPAPSVNPGWLDGGGYPVLDVGGAVPRGQWCTYVGRFTFQNNAHGDFMNLRHRWAIISGYAEFCWEVMRASDAELIVDGAVTADKIQAGAITTAKLQAGAITADKLSSGQLITSSAQIGDAVITNAKIANLSVDTIKIANGAVTSASTIAASNQLTTNSTNWVELTGITITTTGGAIVAIANVDLLYQLYNDTMFNEQLAVAVKVGGDYNVTSVNRSYTVYSNTFYVNPLTPTISGTITGLGAGTHEIVFLWRRLSSQPFNTIINGRSLFLLETKR